MEEDEKYFVAKLSIPFPEKASSRDDLRSSILTTIERAGEKLVVPVEEAVEQAATEEEAPLVETTTTPVIEVVIDKAYSFQE